MQIYVVDATFVSFNARKKYRYGAVIVAGSEADAKKSIESRTRNKSDYCTDCSVSAVGTANEEIREQIIMSEERFS